MCSEWHNGAWLNGNFGDGPQIQGNENYKMPSWTNIKDVSMKLPLNNTEH